MKIGKATTGFKPYTITIESEAEHLFLGGLLTLADNASKQQAQNYDENIKKIMWDLVQSQGAVT